MYLGRGQVITSHRIRGMSLDTRNRHRSPQINRLSVKSTYPMYFVPNILHSVLWIEILHSFENLSAIHSCHINSKRPISLKHITLITFTSIHDFISTVRALLSDCIKTYSNDDSDKNNYWKKNNSNHQLSGISIKTQPFEWSQVKCGISLNTSYNLHNLIL